MKTHAAAQTARYCGHRFQRVQVVPEGSRGLAGPLARLSRRPANLMLWVWSVAYRSMATEPGWCPHSRATAGRRRGSLTPLSALLGTWAEKPAWRTACFTRPGHPPPEGPPGTFRPRQGAGPGLCKVLTAFPGADDGRGAETAGEPRLGRTASSPARITIFTRSYPPAHLRGGPPRSVSALVEALAADFRFSVITSAFDDPAAGPMRSVKPSEWSTFGHAIIWYERRYRISAWRTATLLKETKPQLVYLNSFFDYRFAIRPLFITRMKSRKTPIVLAPRGEFSVGALALKWQKKRAFITAFRMLRFDKAVTWHVSTRQEKADIERLFGPGARCHVAIDLRTGLSVDGEEQYRDERPGTDNALLLPRLLLSHSAKEECRNSHQGDTAR